MTVKGDGTPTVIYLANPVEVTLGTPDGTWSDEYKTVTETVDLGTSGEIVPRTWAEDTEWRIG